jgi:hypothetical protein
MACQAAASRRRVDTVDTPKTLYGYAPVRVSDGPYAPAGTAAVGGSPALAEFPDWSGVHLRGTGDRQAHPPVIEASPK